MNLLPAKITLEKIIALYNSMTADEKNVTAIERDLMLSYIRQLYETFKEGQVIPVQQPVVLQKTNPIVTPTPVVVKAESARVEQVYQRPTLSPSVETIRTVEEAPRREERIVAPEPPKYIVPTPPPSPQPEPPKYVTPTSSPVHVQQQSVQRTERKINPDVLELFEIGSGKEISERLANTPIADLTKGLGLNDRLLNQNELFGGSKVVFDEALKDLNNMSSFDTARAFLEDLAVRYHWMTSEDRKKIAKNFIRFVKRRY